MKTKKPINKFVSKKISRKEAIKKAGVTALTTASLMFLQTKAKAQDSFGSGQDPGDGRGGRGGR
jgi:hypothetical protein